MDPNIIPIVGMSIPIAIVAIVFAYVYQNRKMLHQERLAMIEKGMLPDNLKELSEEDGIAHPDRLLSNGITTAAVGLAILIGLGFGLGSGPWLLGGLIPLAVGLGNIITYMVRPRNQSSSEKN